MKNLTLDSEALTASPSALLETVLQILPDATVLVDQNLTVLFCNEKARDEVRMNLRQDLLPGVSLPDVLPRTYRTSFRRFFSAACRGFAHTTETSLSVSGHPQTFYEISFVPARNRDGAVSAVLITAKNITRRVQSGQAIKEAEERWQFAFEASNQAAWEWNVQTGEVIFSGSYKKLFGFAQDELRGTMDTWHDRVHPNDRQKLADAIEAHSRAKDPLHETTYRVQTNNGEYKWIMARGKVVSRDAHGRPLRMIGTHTDLTETLKAKEEIQRSNERFLYAARASSQALWEWNALTGEAYVSSMFTELFGWQADENQRFEQWHQYVHPDDREQVVKDYYTTLGNAEKNIWQATYRLLKADGTYAIVSDKAYLLRDETHAVKKVIGATEDVTALRKTEAELRRSNERYDLLLLATNELIFEWDMRSNQVLRPQRGINEVYGIRDESEVATVDQWFERVHPDDQPRIAERFGDLASGRHMQTYEMEYRLRNDDGEYNDVHSRAILLLDNDGVPRRVIGSEQNITERKRLERELLENELETKKRINQATVDSQEQERGEIGRELHDNVNQVLTTTKLYLELALSAGAPPADLLQRSRTNISHVINEIRQLSRSLMDPTIGDLGISDAIHDLVENLNITKKVAISLAVEEDIDERLNKRQKLTIFRIVQEALNNVIRHAAAKKVNIRLHSTGANVVLAVADDGEGFALTTVKKGAGLKNISNRVYLVNGSLNVQSSPGTGCTVTVNFPLQPNE